MNSLSNKKKIFFVIIVMFLFVIFFSHFVYTGRNSVCSTTEIECTETKQGSKPKEHSNNSQQDSNNSQLKQDDEAFPPLIQEPDPVVSKDCDIVIPQFLHQRDSIIRNHYSPVCVHCKLDGIRQFKVNLISKKGEVFESHSIVVHSGYGCVSVAGKIPQIHRSILVNVQERGKEILSKVTKVETIKCDSDMVSVVTEKMFVSVICVRENMEVSNYQDITLRGSVIVANSTASIKVVDGRITFMRNVAHRPLLITSSSIESPRETSFIISDHGVVELINAWVVQNDHSTTSFAQTTKGGFAMLYGGTVGGSFLTSIETSVSMRNVTMFSSSASNILHIRGGHQFLHTIHAVSQKTPIFFEDNNSMFKTVVKNSDIYSSSHGIIARNIGNLTMDHTNCTSISETCIDSEGKPQLITTTGKFSSRIDLVTQVIIPVCPETENSVGRGYSHKIQVVEWHGMNYTIRKETFPNRIRNKILQHALISTQKFMLERLMILSDSILEHDLCLTSANLSMTHMIPFFKGDDMNFMRKKPEKKLSVVSLPWSKTIHMAYNVAKSVAFIHFKGPLGEFIHGDIHACHGCKGERNALFSPWYNNNIMLNAEQGKAIVIDLDTSLNHGRFTVPWKYQKVSPISRRSFAEARRVEVAILGSYFWSLISVAKKPWPPERCSECPKYCNLIKDAMNLKQEMTSIQLAENVFKLHEVCS